MELKVAIPTTPPQPPPATAPTSPSDFNFISGCSTPYTSAPSSPPQYHHRHTNNSLFLYYSAPTSPRSSDLECLPLLLDPADSNKGTSSSVPFNWEDRPGVPISCENNYQEDFEFDFSGQLQLERPSLSAEELFDGGKIKPLKPPPRLQSTFANITSDSPKSPRFSKFRGSFSPKQKDVDFDPFEAALERTRNSSYVGGSCGGSERIIPRGREKFSSNNTRPGNSNNNDNRMNNRKKGMSRSLSPLRVSEFAAVQRQYIENNCGPSSSTRPYRKWSLKDFFLFRSASEGRATSKDTLKKYFPSSSNPANGSVSTSGGYGGSRKFYDWKDSCNPSFRSTEESEGSISRRRRSQLSEQASAHELHYNVNRAVAEDLKKKTSLPYKHGFLGCLGLGFTSSGVQQISRGIGSVYGS